MYKIQTNITGSREMFITDEHLQTIKERSLFKDLVGSTGIVNEDVLDKLKLMVRSLMEAEPESHDLINFSHEVLYNDNMKAHGLNQLLQLYQNWIQTRDEIEENIEQEPE